MLTLSSLWCIAGSFLWQGLSVVAHNIAHVWCLLKEKEKKIFHYGQAYTPL